MELSLATVLVFVTGVLAGVVAGLGVIAPLTSNKIDDKVKEFAEKALGVLQGVSTPAAKA